jgi:hypothetical protein
MMGSFKFHKSAPLKVLMCLFKHHPMGKRGQTTKALQISCRKAELKEAKA